jgi:hypothetical protein
MVLVAEYPTTAPFAIIGCGTVSVMVYTYFSTGNRGVVPSVFVVLLMEIF